MRDVFDQEIKAGQILISRYGDTFKVILDQDFGLSIKNVHTLVIEKLFPEIASQLQIAGTYWEDKTSTIL